MKHQIRRIVVAALAVAMVSQAFVASAAAGTGCTSRDLVPVLHSTTASQGLPANPLVRGKKTIVRFYLTHPECASSTQWIKLSGASLAVGRGGTSESLGTVANKNSLSTPALISAWNAPSTDSQGDPFFAVPGSVLAPASTTGAYDATFTANISYTTNFSTKSSSTSKQFTFSVPVAQATNNLRVLAIPMGDPTGTKNNTEVQFTSGYEDSAADRTVKGMGTLSRIFPVPDGTGSLAESTGGGIRYTLDLAALVDVSKFMTNGVAPSAKFCGNDTNGSEVQGKLANFLTQYNTAPENAGETADRVLGVADTTISVACFEGYAGVVAKEAWARTSSIAGSIFAMEEAHNSGAVTLVRSSLFDLYHSPLTYADATAPNRGYDITGEKFLQDDRSVMKYLGQPEGWGDGTTLLEKGDWEQVFCRLGGPVTTDCQITQIEGAAGASNGAARFHVVGLTDGTPEGTEILDSYSANGPSTPASGTDYFFVQRSGSDILDSDPVAVEESHSGHDGTSPEVRAHTHKNFFSFSYDAHASADRWELWKGTPDAPASTLLTERIKAQASPTVGTVSAETKTEDPRTVDFDDATPLDDPRNRYAGRGVVFGPEVRDGSVPSFFADLTASSAPITLVNDAAIAGDERVTPVGGPQPMTIRFPSPVETVGMNIGNGLVGTTATLVAYDAAGEAIGESAVTGFGKAVTTRLAVAPDAGGIHKVTLLYTDSDGTPSTQSEQIDDLTFTPGSGQTYNATATSSVAEGEDPQKLRGAFFLQCPSQSLPVAVGLLPTSTTENTATFEHSFSSSFACEDGGKASLTFRANDGFETTGFSDAAVIDAPDKAPFPAIESPRINASVVQHRSIALSGQAYDVTYGALPGDRLEWFISGPNYPERSVGTGTSLSVPAPVENGGRWNPGTYHVRLEAAGLTGLKSAATAEIVVHKDEDNDGIPFEVEQCFATGPDDNPDIDPFNVTGDFDGDGLRNGDDPDPCSHEESFVLSANFDPDNIYVPSTGNDFTYYVSGNSNLNNVIPASVRISKIDGVAVSPTDPLFNGTPKGWQVGDDGVATAKFDRQAVSRYLEREGLINKFVLFTITGSGTTDETEWTFEGNDASLVRPAN